uniref:Amine oxidase n=1 Tax=Parascaris univalens TaxID=6257 RepID=A0A915BY59_PARUN
VCHVSPQLSPREGATRYDDYQGKLEVDSVVLSMDDTVKVEADDKLQMEDEGDDEEVATTSTRVRHRRECAEVAKKKLRLDLRPTELKNILEQNSGEHASESNDSREASCDRSECGFEKQCSLAISTICFNREKSRTPMERGSTPCEVSTPHSNGGNNSNGNGGGKIFYHISKGEHVCQSCHDEICKPGRETNDRFNEWKGKWSTESRCSPFVRLFVQDQLLPFWLQCKLCNKFRRLSPHYKSITPDDIERFVCGSMNLDSDTSEENDPCDAPEDECVREASETAWIQSITAAPLLHNSPALHYLRHEYYYDEVGISPTNADFESDTGI